MLCHGFGHMPGASKATVEENLTHHTFIPPSFSLSHFVSEEAFPSFFFLTPLFIHLLALSSLPPSLSLFTFLVFNLIPLANQNLLRPIVRGQRGFSTHDQDALSLIVPVVVKVELAAFGRILVCTGVNL